MPYSDGRLSNPTDVSIFTYEKLSRAMRVLIDAEHEAMRLYGYIARSTDKKLTVELLEDATEGERFYAESLKSAVDQNGTALFSVSKRIVSNSFDRKDVLI